MWRVYVIELKPRALELDTNRRSSPTGLPYVYVGQSWHDPETRMEKHRLGGSGASSKVRNYGRRLRPELYLHLPPCSSDVQARASEREHAEALAEIGFPTRSDGVLTRPRGNEVRLLERIHPAVEDTFDEVVFGLCARNAKWAVTRLADALCFLPASGCRGDAGRFAHVSRSAVVERLRELEARGYLAVAAGRKEVRFQQ